MSRLLKPRKTPIRKGKRVNFMPPVASVKNTDTTAEQMFMAYVVQHQNMQTEYEKMKAQLNQFLKTTASKKRRVEEIRNRYTDEKITSTGKKQRTSPRLDPCDLLELRGIHEETKQLEQIVGNELTKFKDVISKNQEIISTVLENYQTFFNIFRDETRRIREHTFVFRAFIEDTQSVTPHLIPTPFVLS
jgi:hypothetical protein